MRTVKFSDVRSLSMLTESGKTAVEMLVNDEAKDPDPSTDVVKTRNELQTALNDGAIDITLNALINVTPETAINIPRNIARIIRGVNNSNIYGNGQDFRILRSDGAGGDLTIIGLGINGGWRSNPGECPDDRAGNFYLPGFDKLTLRECSTSYSRRTGIFAPNTGELTLTNCYGYALPRDFVWANGTRKFRADGCVVQHCCDDGIGCHLNRGDSGKNREVIIRNNILRCTLGIKVLGGGKSVLIENNIIEWPGFYGIRLGLDPTTGEGDIDQENITVRNNTISDVQITSPSHPGQRQGVWLFMYAPNSVCRNVSFGGNILRRTGDDWPSYASKYVWEKDGYFAKPGFIKDYRADTGSEAIRLICANPKDVIVSGNVLDGLQW